MIDYPTVGTIPPRAKKRFAGPEAILVMFGVAAILAAVGFWVSMPIAGVLFVAGFAVMAATRADLAFAFMLASAPFVWDLGGGGVKFAASDLAAVLALPVFLLVGRGRAFSSPVWLPIIAYLLVCMVSTLISGGASDIGSSISSILQMIIYLIVEVFIFSACVRDPRELYPGLYAMLGSNVILAIAELVSRSNYVLGLHKNGVGTHLAFAVIVAIPLLIDAADRKRRRIIAVTLGVLVIGLVLTLSRGAWIGAGSAILLMSMLRGRLKSSIVLLAAVAPLIVVAWLLLPGESREYAADLSAEAHNIKARWDSIDFALGYFKANPILGIGVGLRKMYDATNLVMSTLAETGVVGLTALLAIFGTIAWIAQWAARRLPAGSASRPLLVIGVGLIACKFVHGLVDHYWSRGILPAWAGAGMVAYAFREARNQHHRSSLSRNVSHRKTAERVGTSDATETQ